jgi:hypothetical protein
MVVLSFTKTGHYKELLSESYWEIHEAAWILSGCEEFEGWYNLRPACTAIVKRNSFGLIPKGFLNSLVPEECYRKYGLILMKLFEVSQKDGIEVIPFKLEYLERNWKDPKYSKFPKKHAYFLSSEDLIAIAVTEGILLPIELQIAFGAYQLRTTTPLSVPDKRRIQRESIAKAFWFKYQDDTISGICRRISKLKKYKQFSFLHDSLNRTRVVVTKMRPRSVSEHLQPPGMSFDGGGVAFDFAYLNVAVNIIADLLRASKEITSGSELMQHPLIRCWGSVGGSFVSQIVKFCLRGVIDDLEQSVAQD